MRILYITADSGVEVGGRKGSSTHIRETCRALVQRGHEVLLLTPAPGDSRLTPCPVQHVEPPQGRWLGSDLRHLIYNRMMYYAVDQAVKSFQPDAIYERYALYQTAGAILSREHNLPRILEINSMLAMEQSHRLHFPFLATLAENRLWSKESAIICVSENLKSRIIAAAEIEKQDRDRITVCPTGVDPKMFYPDVEPDKEILELAAGRRIIGYTGTVTAWHGIDRLFDLAELVQEDREKFIILVVGGDDVRLDELRRRAEVSGVASILHFFGSVPHDRIPSVISAADVCVIPDTQDWSAPTKFFEFAAMAKPIVAARSPSVEEVFGSQDEETGFFFERGNVPDFRTAVLHALNLEEEAQVRGERARARVLSRYTWDHNISTIMEIYRKQGLELASKADRKGD